jgi:hypothetical protein
MTGIRGNWRGRGATRCALWLAIALPAAAPAPAAAQAAPATAEYVDRAIRSSPQYQRTFTALRTHYPRDYQALLEVAATLLRTSDLPTMRGAAFAHMRGFMAGKADALFAAPEADLAALAVAYGDLAEALAAVDVRLCAQWSMTGFSPSAQPPASVIGLLDGINEAQINAIHNSETGGAVNRAPIGAADMQGLLARIQAVDPATASLFTGGGISTATAEQQCQSGRTLYRVVAELPAPQAAAFTAFLLRQYFRAPPTPVSVP